MEPIRCKNAMERRMLQEALELRWAHLRIERLLDQNVELLKEGIADKERIEKLQKMIIKLIQTHGKETNRHREQE